MPPGSPDPSRPESLGGSGPNTSSPAPAQGARPALRRVASAELFGDAAELVIVHGEREYRLRVTSNGKLILTA
ncbi:MAG: hemin uptake protein HemP [Burkholderiales bacterium]|nr:hemin uptake protein HemP [Burkholderiales bacterium]